MKTRAKKRVSRSRISAMVSAPLKRRLAKASVEGDVTMTAVLESILDDNLPEENDLKVGPGIGDAWVKTNRGILKGKFSKEDYERDDLLGHLLRKHAS